MWQPNRLIVLAIAAALLLTAAPQYQVFTIAGVVHFGSTVTPGARVVLIDRQSNRQFTTQTDSAGRYVFASVPVGVYDVRAEASGFAAAQRAISTAPGTSIRVDIDLAPPPPPSNLPSQPSNSPIGGGGPIGQGAPPGILRPTGRAFLVRPYIEVPGYGLYSYMLFGSGPTAATRPLYEKAVEAFLQVISDVADLEAANVPRQRLNITYLPMNPPPATAINPQPQWIVQNYDYARAQAILGNLPGGIRSGGPYFVSTLKPLSTNYPDRFLFQDLSNVPPTLIVPWIKAFMIQASKDQFWEQSAVNRLVLNLRTQVEIAANGLTEVEKAGKDWKSLVAALIVVK